MLFNDIEGAVVRTLDIREPTEIGKWDSIPWVMCGAEFEGFIDALRDTFPGWSFGHHGPRVLPLGSPGLKIAHSSRVVLLVYGPNDAMQVAFIPNPTADAKAAAKATAKAADRFFRAVHTFYPGALDAREVSHAA